MEPKNVLIVDDEPNIRHMLSTALRLEGYQPDTAATAAEALSLVAKSRYRVILCDIRLPDLSGLELLEKIKETDHHNIVIMISAYGSIDTAMEAVRKGANDFLSKPFSPDEIILRIRKAEEQDRLREENCRLQREIRERYSFQNILGKNAAMQGLFERVRKVASSKTTVLITGESGTGKELFARAIHYVSQRRDEPFVAINCGAIPENLLESELFGHVRGAFTGATGHKRGLFEEANGGTLFLDEIGELPLALQVKLLRALQEEEIRKVGDTKTHKVDVRVIAATARNLEEEVKQGRFREELYYRLNVVTVSIPPLRERREDIPLLADHYIRKLSEVNRREPRELSPAALQLLMRYHWPGNVRELVNMLEQAVLLSEGERIEASDLPEALRAGAPAASLPAVEGFSLKQHRAVLEQRLISEALRECRQSRTKAAALLGISLRSLLYKIKEHGIDREE